MTYGSTSYGAAPYGAGAGALGQTLYWAVQLVETTDWTDDATGGARIAAGQDGIGAPLPAGRYGSQAYEGTGDIDMDVAASGLTPGFGYEIGFVVHDADTDSYSNVVVSAEITTTAIPAVVYSTGSGAGGGGARTRRNVALEQEEALAEALARRRQQEDQEMSEVLEIIMAIAAAELI